MELQFTQCLDSQIKNPWFESPQWRFIYRRKEGNVLFNDTLNTFYLWLYGVRHMVKDHLDSKRGNPLLPHGLFFLFSSKGFLYAPSHRITHTTAFVTPSHGALAGTRNSLMGPP